MMSSSFFRCRFWQITLAVLACSHFNRSLAIENQVEKEEVATASQRSWPVPDWLYEGYVSVQTCEGPGLLRGLCTVESPKNIAERLDPKMADRLAGQGIRFVILNGIGGMGLPNEMPILEANKPLSAALKAKGIRRVLYVQTIGTMFCQPFYATVPGSKDWAQIGPDGIRPTYYDQWFRQIPCLNNQAFVDYTKNVIQTAMRELDLDGIFTDNYGYYSWSCQCEHCQRMFREYLSKKYPTPAARKARFETEAPFDYVMIPPFRTLGSGTGHTMIPEEHQIIDPVSQEWIQFRCERLGEVTHEFNQAIKEVNPKGIFYINYLYGGLPGLNLSLFHGSWAPWVYPNADLISAEASNRPHFENGVAQGRTMVMKIAKRFKVPLSACGAGTRVALAEGMVFNTAKIDWIGDILQPSDPAQWMRDYQDFYSQHRDQIGKADTVADCAVLHSFETLSYTCTYPQESLVLCEQSLLQGGITYDVIFNDDLDHLDKYRCLFLPNSLAMSRPAVEKIAAFVKRGGAVVATEDTSILNQYMLPWKAQWLSAHKTHLLADQLGLEWPKEGVLKQEVGKGRVSFIAKVERPWGDQRPKTPSDHGNADQTTLMKTPWDFAEHWPGGPTIPLIMRAPHLANNHQQIIDAVNYALDEARTIRLETDKPVIPEVTRNDHGEFVHLINWDESQPVSDLPVSLLAPSRKVKSIELISPDRETEPARIEFTKRDGRIEFKVPKLLCYNVIVIQ